MSSRIRSEFGSIGERAGAVEPSVRVVEPQHVWVDGHHAGLLLAWRQLATWQGRVFWCPPGSHEAALDWIPTARLAPRQ